MVKEIQEDIISNIDSKEKKLIEVRGRPAHDKT